MMFSRVGKEKKNAAKNQPTVIRLLVKERESAAIRSSVGDAERKESYYERS